MKAEDHLVVLPTRPDRSARVLPRIEARLFAFRENTFTLVNTHSAWLCQARFVP